MDAIWNEEEMAVIESDPVMIKVNFTKYLYENP